MALLASMLSCDTHLCELQGIVGREVVRGSLVGEIDGVNGDGGEWGGGTARQLWRTATPLGLSVRSAA